MPDTIRTGRSYAHRRRSRGIGGSLAAIAAIASFPAAAAEQPTLALQELVLTAHRSIDQHQIAFLALVFGVVLFAVVTAVMLVRARTRMARLEAWSRDEITRLRGELDRANAVILSEPQVVVDWPAGSDAPGIEGDLAALGVSASHRVLAFGSWLGAAKASAMERAVETLRARGEAFSMTLTTLAGHPVEAQGRVIAGRAVLRLKDANGIKRELVDLVGRYEKQSTELAALRALAEKLTVAGVDARRRGTSDLRQRRLRARRRRKELRPTPSNAGWNCSIAPRAKASPRRGRPAAIMRAGCAPSPPASGAASTCSIFAPRPAAPASA